MEDIETYLTKLRKRYRRFFAFDRVLCISLGLSSVFSLYGFFNYDSSKGFYLAGAASAVLVSYLGFRANQLLLKEEKKGRKIGYLATSLFAFSGISAPIYLMWVIYKPIGGFDIDIIWSIGPVTSYFLFFVGAYRGLYHLSAHNYVKIFIERKRAEQMGSHNSGSHAPFA